MQFHQLHRDVMGYMDHGPMWYMPSGHTSSHLLPAPPAGLPSPHGQLPPPNLHHAPFGAHGQHHQPVAHPFPQGRTRFLSTDSSCPDGEGEVPSFTPAVALADLTHLAHGQEHLAIPPAGVQAALEALAQSGQLLCSKSATGKPLKGAAKVKAQAKTSAALLASAHAGTLCITALLSAQGLASLGMGMGMCPTEALVRALAEVVPTSGPRAVPGQAITAPALPSLTSMSGGAGGASGGQGTRKASFALSGYQYEGHGYGHMGGGQLYSTAEAGHFVPVSRSSPPSSAAAAAVVNPPLAGGQPHQGGQGQNSHAFKRSAGQQSTSSGASKTAGPAGRSGAVAGSSSSCTASSPTTATAQAQGEARRPAPAGEGEERPSHLMHVQSGEEGFTWGRLLMSPSAVCRKRGRREEAEEVQHGGEETQACGAPPGEEASQAGKKACRSPRHSCPYSVPYSLSCVTDSGPLYTQWTSYRLKTEVLAFRGRVGQGGQGQEGTYLLARAPQLSHDGYDQYQLLQASVLGGSDSSCMPLISLLHHLPMPPSPGSTYALPLEDEGATGPLGRMLHVTVQACEGIQACLALDWCDLLWTCAGVQVRCGPPSPHSLSLHLHSVRPLAHTPAQWKGTVASQTQESDDEEHRSLAACSSRGSEGGCGQGGSCSPHSMHQAVPHHTHQGGAAMMVMTSSRTAQGEEEMDARSLLSGSGPGSPAPFSAHGLGPMGPMGMGGGTGGGGGAAHGQQEQPLAGKERDTLTRDRTETVTEWPAAQAEARA